MEGLIIMKIPIYCKVARFVGMRRWIRVGLRYKFWIHLKNYNFSIPFYGYVYEGSLDDYIDRQTFLFGSYEHDELEYLKRFLSIDSTVLDIGCNTGHHALFFSRFSKTVHAFDPYKKVIDVLYTRIKRNNIENIIVHNIGLGVEDGEMNYYKPPVGENQGVGTFVQKTDNNNNYEKLLVKNADNFIKELAIDKISLIKIDVEGFEHEVLKGLKVSLEKNRPVVFFEFNKENERFGTYNNMKDCFPMEYTPYMIQTNRPVLWLFNNPHIGLVSFDFDNPIGENVIFIPNELNKTIKS